MSNTDLALKGLVKPIDIPGLEDYNTNDFRPGRWKIVQTDLQAKDWGAKKGSFYNPDTGEQRDELSGFVAIAVKKPRGINKYTYDTREAAKARGEDVTDYCRSKDGRVPDADSREPQAPSCLACPYSKFTEKDGKHFPPACRDRRTFHLIEVETGIPSVFNTAKAGNAAVDKALQAVAMRRRPPAHFPLTIKLEEVADKNIYWKPVPVFDVRNPLDEEAARNMLAMTSELADLFGVLGREDHEDEHQEDGHKSERCGSVQVDADPIEEAPAPNAPEVLKPTVIKEIISADDVDVDADEADFINELEL